MEVSGGFTGISIYQPFDVLTNQSYYSNLERRDDGWGAGEYNPYVVDPYAIPPLFAQPADLHVAVSETWGHRAHVLWPQFWGDVVYPAYDCATNRWERDAVTLNFAGWTAVNMAPHGVPASVLKATTTGASYLESPTVSIPAASFPFVVVDASFTYAASMLSLGPVRVDFLTQGSSNWYSVSQDIGRPSTPGHRFAVLDMSASSSWSGTVTRLRLYPTPVSGDWVHVGTFVVGGRNPLTQELHQLLLAKKDTPRPAPVAPFVVSLPFNVAAGIAPADAAGNLSVFGTEPTGGTQFNNFATAGNFFRNSAAASGGVARDAIVAAASNYTGSGADHSRLGLRKTGKFRRLELPDVSDLHLSFRMGIQDGFASTDGVRYRVVLRDAARQLHELFLDEWRTNAWSAKQTVSLADWAGEIVDLAFETSSISDAVRDRSLWGEPTIERIFTLAANASGSGQLVPDPTGSYPQGTVVPLNAQASPGWIFTSWTTTGNPADIASPTSATTTITLNGHHTLTAHFAQLTTQAFESRGPDDGWVLESTATSGVGRTSNAGATGGGAVRIGDSGLDQQFKSLLSFDTTGAIPPSATLVSATLRLVRGTQVGDPTALGAIQADVAPGFFGTSAALEAVDFQSLPPNLAVNAATLNYPAADGQVASAALSAAGLAAVNLNGLTQMRIAFATGDDANATLDYLGFHPGEAAVPADRPVLELVWY
jgi:hypothetical protein